MRFLLLGIGFLVPTLSLGSNGPFEGIVWDARARAMGNSAVALPYNTEAFISNPAIISVGNTIAFTAQQNLDGLTIGSEQIGSMQLSIKTLPALQMNFGLSMYNLTAREVNLHQQLIFGCGLTYNIRDMIYTGLVVQYFRNMTDYQRQDLASDAIDVGFGTIITTPWHLNLGFAGYNLIGSEVGYFEKSPIPLDLNMGLAYLPIEQFVFTASTNNHVDRLNNEWSTSYHSGIECGYADLPMKIRFGGILFPDNIFKWLAGLSVTWKGWQLDYTYEPPSGAQKDLSNSNIITVSFLW